MSAPPATGATSRGCGRRRASRSATSTSSRPGTRTTAAGSGAVPGPAVAVPGADVPADLLLAADGGGDEVWILTHPAPATLGARALVRDRGGNRAEQLLGAALMAACGFFAGTSAAATCRSRRFSLFPLILWAFRRALADAALGGAGRGAVRAGGPEGGTYPAAAHGRSRWRSSGWRGSARRTTGAGWRSRWRSSPCCSGAARGGRACCRCCTTCGSTRA